MAPAGFTYVIGQSERNERGTAVYCACGNFCSSAQVGVQRPGPKQLLDGGPGLKPDNSVGLAYARQIAIGYPTVVTE